jgi:hypothetical protein
MARPIPVRKSTSYDKQKKQESQLVRDKLTGKDVFKESGQPLVPEVKIYSRPTGTDPSKNVDITNLSPEERKVIQEKNARVGRVLEGASKAASEGEAKDIAIQEILSKELPQEETTPIPEQAQVAQPTQRLTPAGQPLTEFIKEAFLGKTETSTGEPILAGTAPIITGAGVTSILPSITKALPSIKTLDISKKVLSFKSLLTLGAVGTSIKLRANTAQNILGSSLTRAEQIFKEVEAGRDYTDAQIELEEVYNNIRQAENTATAMSKVDLFGFLGLKDTLVKFQYAKPAIENFNNDLLEARQKALLTKYGLSQ